MSTRTTVDPGAPRPDPAPSVGVIERAQRWLRAMAMAPIVVRSGLFDRSYYTTRYPNVMASRVPPLMHYLVHGWRAGHCPRLLFDTRWYLDKNPDVRDANIEPLYHYLRHGHREGRDPHPLFGTAFYLDRNPDVRAAGLNPLVHYVRAGAGEGRDSHPLFDSAWYLEQNSDAHAAGWNPLVHFLSHGDQEGRNPHPLFLTAWYRREYRDAAAAGNALIHYLGAGVKQGYDPHPLFDTEWYLETNPEVAQAGVNPLEHYVRWGGSEGREPNPFFDTRWFFEGNPEARASGRLPLVSYAARGFADGDRAHRVASPAVLIVDHRFPMPDVDAGSVRMEGIIEAFVNLGYSVTFVSDNEEVPRAYRKRLAAKGVYPLLGIDSAFGHLERQGGVYATVLVSRPAVGTRYLMAIHAHAPSARVLYDTVDLHWLRLLRTAAVTGDPVHLLAADDHRRRESYCIGAADVTIAVTAEEEQCIQEAWPGTRVAIIHTIHRLDPLPINWEQRSGLVFIGGFEHTPNGDAMVWFVQSILPLVLAGNPVIKLTILGSKTPQRIRELASATVNVAGYVPRVEPHFAGARIFVSPLRFGAGMKGKIGQAMSLGLPVVTTAVGAEGMSIVDGRHALIAEDAATFAARILELYDDFALWQRLRENALRLVDERFSPRAAQEAIHRIMLETAGLPVEARTACGGGGR